MNYLLHTITKKHFITFFLTIFTTTIWCHSSILYAEEEDINKKIIPGHYFAYIIYEKAEKNLPILYTTYILLSDYEGSEEVPGIQLFLKPGSYTMESAGSYDPLDFELEVTESEKIKRFNFKLKENQFYYALIGIDEHGQPTIKWLNATKGRELIKKYHRANLLK